MSYKDKYNTDLLQINKLIDDDKFEGEDGALEKFKTHLKEVIDIGRFSNMNWNKAWRRNVYEFGTKFKKIDPIDFLYALKHEKDKAKKDQKEVLDFYYSEIEVNSLPNELTTKRFKKLIATYPYNPEFHHNLGHYYASNKKHKKAINQYNFALEKDPDFHSFKKSLFEVYRAYLEKLIEKSEYEKGLSICEELLVEKKFWGAGGLHNYILALKERFKDYILLNQKINAAEIKINNIVTEETKKSQARIIEILGFFTAIIAFIFSTVSIGKNFSFEQAIIFNLTLGLTLILFITASSILFSHRQVAIFSLRLPLLIILALSLLLIVTKFGIPFWI